MRREIDLEARPENLKTIRDFIAEACHEAGVPADVSGDLKLAVDEACANVVEHGYAGHSGRAPIGVLFEADEEKIEVTVTDRGRSFDPSRAPQPDIGAGWRDRRIGGLGWHLIRKLVDDVRYESGENAGNRLTLVKRRPAADSKNQGPEGG